MVVCPTKAIFRNPRTGAVDVNRDACIGCHSCAMVCPFGAPQFFTQGKMYKCDLCMERVMHGMEPACVRTCTTRALGFGSMKELAEKKAEEASIRILDSLLTFSP
jgi:Fe-S-cluster-containing dehydrogenase component